MSSSSHPQAKEQDHNMATREDQVAITSEHDQDIQMDGSGSNKKAKGEDGQASNGAVKSVKKKVTAPPSKRACVFCRSRKSRCDGQQPCGTCRKRGDPESCHYTISRRGGRSKVQRRSEDGTNTSANTGSNSSDTRRSSALEDHLAHLFDLSDLPETVRVPGAVPELAPYQQEQYTSPQPLQGPLSHSDGQASVSPFDSGQGDAMQMAQMFSVPPFEAQSSSALDVDAALASMGLSSMPVQVPPLVQSSAPGPQQLSSDVVNQEWDGMLDSLVSWHSEGMPSGMPSASASSQASTGQPPVPTQSAMNTSGGVTPLLATTPGQQPLFPYPAQPQSLPQLHPQPTTQPSPAPQPQNQQTSFPIARSSKERRSVLTEYYCSLYRFIPVSLPATAPDHIGTLDRTLPATENSPFLLALHAILPLLRNRANKVLSDQDRAKADARREILHRQAAWYERRATEAIDAVLERADEEEGGPHGQHHDPASLGENTRRSSCERTVEVIQALVILAIYHYGCGRALKCRTKTDQAVGLAMAMGMHRTASSTAASPSSSTSTSHANGVQRQRSDPQSYGTDSGPLAPDVEMRKRCWWTVWTLVLWSAYNTARNPTLRVDDPRITCGMPFSYTSDSWAGHISSLQAVLYVQERILALTSLTEGEEDDPNFRFDGQAELAKIEKEEAQMSFSSLPTNATRHDVLRSMLQLDRSLQAQIEAFEKNKLTDLKLGLSGQTSLTGNSEVSPEGARVEEELEEYLHQSAAVQLYTASLALHIPQAFQGASLFERKLCFLNTASEGSDGQNDSACQVPMPDVTAFLDRLDTPSSPQDLTPVGGVTSASELYARGPFLPRLSLQRCVHASKQLLSIGQRSKQRANERVAAAGGANGHGPRAPPPHVFASAAQDPNPFNACSYVLISFTFLMQALAIAGADPDDIRPDLVEGLSPRGEITEAASDVGPDLDQSPDNPHLSRGLLNSARGATVLNGSEQSAAQPMQTDESPSSPTLAAQAESLAAAAQASGPTPAHRIARLREIWRRVQEARDTLASLATSYSIVMPMADEVQLCLQTSQLLLTNNRQTRTA